MTTDWSKPTRYIAGVSLALLGIFILYISRPVIPLLVIAGLIAVIVRPLIGWLHNQARFPRGLAVAVTYLLVAIVVPLALLLAIPAMFDAVSYVLSLDYRSIAEDGLALVQATLNGWKNVEIPVPGLDDYFDQMADTILVQLSRQAAADRVVITPTVGTIMQSLTTALTTTFRTAAGLVGSIFSRVALMLFIFLVSIYMSLSAHTWHDAFMRAVPERFQPEITLLLARIGRMWNSFFRGELVLMLVIGVISWVGLTILGVPGAIYLGIIAGLLELIPNLGPIIATIPAVIVALLQGSNTLPVSPGLLALIVIVFYILVQQFENNLIVPRVLGGAVDLPALVVMTGVLVGAETAGLLGALLATPVIATLRELVRYVYLKILGQNPFPPEDKSPARQEIASPARLRAWLERTSLYRRFRPAPPASQPEPAAPELSPGAQVDDKKK